MDYSREQGLICASFAVRASLIVKQYERLLRMSPGEPAMDATLTIMSLHAVSTNFQEYQRSLPTRARKALDGEVEEGLGAAIGTLVVESTFSDRSRSWKQMVTHLRNATSHPTAKVVEPLLKSTGYDAITTDQEVTGFRFVDSPWVRNGRLISEMRTVEAGCETPKTYVPV